MKIKQIQFMVRIILGCALVVLIWNRVDWTVGLFAFLVLLRVEVEDFFILKVYKRD